MKITKHILLLFLLSVSMSYPYQKASGQTLDFFKEGISPQTALINRFGTYPVDLSTGLVDVSIPLHAVETTNGLKFPIQLKFHASGLRSNEQEGLLGIRWALCAGAHVNRVIKGYPDESYPFNPEVANERFMPDFNALFGTTSVIPYNRSGTNTSFTSRILLDNGQYWEGGAFRDTEYDVFSFCLPSGRSGQFILQEKGGVKQAFTMPYEPLEIYVMHDGTSGKAYNRVTIVDEDGVTYSFGEERELPNHTSVRYVDVNADSYVTTWHLSSVISPNKKDTIELDYIHPNRVVNLWNESLTVSDQLHDNTPFGIFKECEDAGCGFVPSPIYAMIGELLTDQFYYFEHHQGPTYSAQAPYVISSIQYKSDGKLNQKIDFIYEQKNNVPTYLKEITVRNSEKDVVKRICFSLKDNLSRKLKLLDKVEYTDMGASKNRMSYRFDYYDSSFVPACGELAKSSDWWGYYSNYGGWFLSENIAIKNPNSINYLTRNIDGGSKQSDLNSMKIGMIKSVRYPTGGRTNFEYEGNMVSGQIYGGLRIKRVENIPVDGIVESKYYEYEGQVPDYLLPPKKNIFVEKEIECCNYTDYPDLDSYGRYLQRVFLNGFPGQYFDLHSNVVYYTKVTEYLEDKTEGKKQKTVFEYDVKKLDFSYFQTASGEDFEGYESNGYRYKHAFVSPEGFWRKERLKSKQIFKGNQKLKEIRYGYHTFMKDSVYDLPVYRYRLHQTVNRFGDGISAEIANNHKEVNLIYPHQVYQTFAFKHQKYTGGADKLVKETEYTYYPNDTVVVVKEHTYDPQYLLPLSEKITGSEGESVTTKYTYPFNSPVSTSLPYTEMLRKHILTPILTKEEDFGGGNIKKETTSYRKWGTNAFYPSTVVREDIKTAQKDTLLAYTNYSSLGRPTSLLKNNGAERVTCLWSYNHQYPIAYIQNATFEQVVTAISGGESYVDSLASKQMPFDTDFKLIDNLRVALPQALITVASYKPLVGKVSETNASGMVTSNVYDSLGRLIEVSFLENGIKKILKVYDYHYVN